MSKWKQPRKDDTPWSVLLLFELLFIVMAVSSCVNLWIERGQPAWP